MFKVILLICMCLGAFATPPACFLSCANEISHACPNQHLDFTTHCLKEDSMIGCLVDICPYGTFNSARDHFLGTCLEHGKPSKTNPNPPASTAVQDAPEGRGIVQENSENWGDAAKLSLKAGESSGQTPEHDSSSITDPQRGPRLKLVRTPKPPANSVRTAKPNSGMTVPEIDPYGLGSYISPYNQHKKYSRLV